MARMDRNPVVMFKRPLDYEKTFGDSGQQRQTAVVSSYPLPGHYFLHLSPTSYYLSLLVSTRHYSCQNKFFALDRPCSSSTHEADYELQAAPLKMKTPRTEG